MKKYLILLSVCFGISIFAFCQSVGIGTTVPNGSAQLDITSTAKGILIPRMNSAAITSIGNPAKGLMVYDSSKNQLMVNMGTATIPDWEVIVAKSGWSLTGNKGTNQATNFVGTTDPTPLEIKINNVKSGFIDSGTNNTGFGFRTLDSITTGYDNLALGYKVLASNSTGFQNTAVGSNALLFNTSGYYNTASGSQALLQNSTGSWNTAFGALSLWRNATAIGNTAVGLASLYSNTADYNTGLGYQSLISNTTGAGNTGIGTNALAYNDVGYSNVAVGISALYSNRIGSNLVAVGDSSLYNNGIGAIPGWVYATENTAIGSKSLYSNTTGYSNIAIGTRSLVENNIGHDNTAIGVNALRGNTSGDKNIAIGNGALYYNNTGWYNTGIGAYCLYNTTSSQNNTVLGNNAGGGFNMGYNNTILGANSDVNADGLYNCIAIGQGVTCTASSEARIGNSATNSIGGYANWTNFSDGRYKKNIRENVKGIDFIMKLRPVTYQLDVQGISNKLNESRGREMDESTKKSIAEKEKMIFSGFVAQEVEAAARESGYDFSGVDAPKNENDFYGLRYGDFVVPLVKTVQEQQVIIQQQRAVNDNQQQTINDLQKRLQSLEDQMKLLLQSSAHKN